MPLTLSPPAGALATHDDAIGLLPTTAEAAFTGRSRAPVPATSAPLRSRPAVTDVVEEWGLGSFPASDPPSNW